MIHDTKTGLITSGAFVNDELEAEFGRIPPSFLPIGHDCLYIEQIKLLRSWGVEKIYMTLPKDFEYSKFHTQKFKKFNIEIILIATNTSLGQAVYEATRKIKEVTPFFIMHGDTLFTGRPPNIVNFFSIDDKPTHYRWGTVLQELVEGKQKVLTGLFHFENKEKLMKALELEQFDFEAAIKSLVNERFLYTKIEGWLDFGHLQTFFQSKNFVKTSRYFNELVFNKNTVIKSSESKKIISEANWYENIPDILRLYSATYLGRRGKNGYELRNEVLPTLHDLYIFSRLEIDTWLLIKSSISDYLNLCYSDSKVHSEVSKISEINYIEFLIKKTKNRIIDWARSEDIDLFENWELNNELLPSIDHIIKYCESNLMQRESTYNFGVMHGDLCFTNIFYDSRSQLIKVIDPRGHIFDDQDSIYGFLQYDLAKINHSLVGYDEILANRYIHHQSSKYQIKFELEESVLRKRIRGVFASMEILGQSINSPNIQILTILLFISMVPLHADHKQRQRAFIALALSLFKNHMDGYDNNSYGG